MKGFIFLLLLLISAYAQAQLECDSEIMSKVESIFIKGKSDIVHRCIHAQNMEKIITVVERKKDMGAISLFVFSEEGLSPSSQPISAIESFAIDGLREIPSQGKGIKIQKGVGYFNRDSHKEGVIVLQYKNENDFYDLSLVRLKANGHLENYNLHNIDSKYLAISQTNSMDLFIFKVAPEDRVDIVPWSNKVVIGNQWGLSQDQEFYLGGNRVPASLSPPHGE